MALLMYLALGRDARRWSSGNWYPPHLPVASLAWQSQADGTSAGHPARVF